MYKLAEQNGSRLTIDFAAEAEDGVDVSGSYVYDMDSEQISNLQYNQSNDDTQTKNSSTGMPGQTAILLPQIREQTAARNVRTQQRHSLFQQ